MGRGTGDLRVVGGRGGVQEGRGGRTGHFECVWRSREFKEEEENEQVIWWVLEVEVEFKEKEEEEQIVLSVLEVKVEFKEENEEEQVIWWVF